MDSPSAMIMNPAQRSAIWPPSMVQSSIEDAPYFGSQKRAAGDKYSIPRATAHRTSLDCPSAMPPAIQNTADAESQASMRIAFLCKEGRLGGIDASRKAVRPTCIVAEAMANHNPLDSKDFGMGVESTRPPGNTPNNRSRTAVPSGWNPIGN